MLETIRNNPLLLLLLLMTGTAIVGAASLWRLRSEWALFQEWRAAGMPMPAQPLTTATNNASAALFDVTPLAGAGRALKNPPADFRAINSYIKTHRAGDPYTIPLGWQHLHNGEADLLTAQLVGDVNHILITGQSDAGKDNAVMSMFLALATIHRPQQVQFCVIDGKGLDWAAWASKAHTWRVALDPESIASTKAAISAERKRRGTLLLAAGVAKWDEYQGNDLPLLVVFISELSLLEDATKASELAAWLNSELSAGRAFGIRFIIGTQNASNFSTRWRGQIGLFLAGFQPSRSADEPNTGFSTHELESIGAVPPSQLPAPPVGAGVFTAVQGRSAYTVRASFLPSQHRAWVLATLPNKPPKPQPRPAPTTVDTTLLALLHSGQPIPIAEETCSGAIAHSEGIKASVASSIVARSSSALVSVDDPEAALVVAADVVPADEQRRILTAAAGATSRRQISMKLYEATGGQKYTWVQLVCDAAGLLQKGGAQ